MATFKQNDYSAAARIVMGEATRAGIDMDTAAQYHDLARRAEGRGDVKMEIDCLQKALEIHNTWGERHENYSLGRSVVRVIERLTELTVHHAALGEPERSEETPEPGVEIFVE